MSSIELGLVLIQSLLQSKLPVEFSTSRIRLLNARDIKNLSSNETMNSDEEGGLGYLLNEVHEEVNSKVTLEHIFHADYEGVLNAEHDMLF